MKKNLVLIGLVSLSALANAQAATSEDQDSWQAARLQASGYSGELTGYIRENGAYRVDGVPEGLAGEAILDGSQMKITRSIALFSKWCKMAAPGFTGLRSSRNPYALDVAVFPLAKNVALRGYPVRANATTDIQSVAIENAAELQAAEVHIELQPNSYSATVGQLAVANVEAKLSQQLAAQLSTTATTGRAKLALDGLDDLACDLVAGTARVKISARTKFPSAKQWRFPILDGAQYGRLAESVAKPVNLEGADWAGPVVAGARLALSMQKEKDGWFESVGLRNFMSLYASLFDLTGKPQEISAADYVKRARSLDRLENRSNIITYDVAQKIKTVVQ